VFLTFVRAYVCAIKEYVQMHMSVMLPLYQTPDKAFPRMNYVYQPSHCISLQ